MAKTRFYKVTSLPGPGSLTPDSFYFVENGDYVESYVTDDVGVAKYLGNSTMINELIDTKLAAYTGAIIVAVDITDRDTYKDGGVNELSKNALIVVLDASGDPTVNTGSALYLYEDVNDIFHKLAEYESLDIVVDWSSIQNGPTSSGLQVDNAVTQAHSHPNLGVLDSISDSGSGMIITNLERQQLVDLSTNGYFSPGVSNQYNLLTGTTPLDSDRFLFEKSSDGYSKYYTTFADLKSQVGGNQNIDQVLAQGGTLSTSRNFNVGGNQLIFKLSSAGTILVRDDGFAPGGLMIVESGIYFEYLANPNISPYTNHWIRQTNDTSPLNYYSRLGHQLVSDHSSILVRMTDSPSTNRFDFLVDGRARFYTYGSGIWAGAETNILAVDSSGYVIEVDPSSLSITPDLDSVLGVGSTISTDRSVDVNGNTFRFVNGARNLISIPSSGQVDFHDSIRIINLNDTGKALRIDTKDSNSFALYIDGFIGEVFSVGVGGNTMVVSQSLQLPSRGLYAYGGVNSPILVRNSTQTSKYFEVTNTGDVNIDTKALTINGETTHGSYNYGLIIQDDFPAFILWDDEGTTRGHRFESSNGSFKIKEMSALSTVFNDSVLSINWGGIIGIGMTPAGSNRLSIKTYGNTSATRGIDVFNGSNTNLMYLQDDGRLALKSYVGGNFTTPTEEYLLGVDVDGVVVAVDPSGYITAQDFDNVLSQGGSLSTSRSVDLGTYNLDFSNGQVAVGRTPIGTASLVAGDYFAVYPKLSTSYAINLVAQSNEPYIRIIGGGGGTGVYLSQIGSGLKIRRGSYAVSEVSMLQVYGNSTPVLDIQSWYNSSNTEVGRFYDNGTLSVQNLVSSQQVKVNGGFGLYLDSRAYMFSLTPGNINLTSVTTSDFGQLQLGGVSATSAYPAIKRNGSGIDFIKADNSGYATIRQGITTIQGEGTTGSTNSLLIKDSLGATKFFTRDDGILVVGSTYNVSNGLLGQGYFSTSIIRATYLNNNANTHTVARLNTSGFLTVDSGIYVGGTANPTALIGIGPSITTKASINIASGTAPTAPNEGDIWYDGTNLKFRNSSTTIDLGGSSAVFSTDINGAYYDGKVTIGAGATSTDAEFVIQGSGITGTTKSLLVKNSSGTTLFDVYDNGRFTLGTANEARLEALTNEDMYIRSQWTYFQGASNSTFGAVMKVTAAHTSLSINKGNQDADITSVLDLTSTTRGFLPPRMTGAQVEAIASPATSLIVYATNAGSGDVKAAGLYIYNGVKWVSITGGTLFAPASTTLLASINIASGVAPSSPNDGDIWYDGTNLKFRKLSTTVNLDVGAFSIDGSGAYYDGRVTVGLGATSTDAELVVAGAGTTSGTTALLVEDSAGSDILRVRDDRVVIFGNSATVQISDNPSVTLTGRVNIQDGTGGIGRVGGYFNNGQIRIHGNVTDATYIDLYGSTHATYPNAIRVGASSGLTMVDGAIYLVASSTSIPSLRIPSGIAPSSPTEGDVWYDGTNLKFRKSAITVNLDEAAGVPYTGATSNVDLNAKTLTNVSSISASAALFGGAANLRAFNVYGTGLNGRLSIQSSSGGNPGVEMTTNGNTTRTLIKHQEVGTSGTQLEFYTQVDGGAISRYITLYEDGTMYLHPDGAGVTPTLNAGIRNNSGKIEYKDSSDAWKRIQPTTMVYEIGYAVSDETTALVAVPSVIKFRAPRQFTLTEVRASVSTAPTGADLVIDINKNGTTVLSTKLSIDDGQSTSTTATVPAVISDSSITDDAEITIDIDQVGSTVAGSGLKIWLKGTINV